MNRLAQLKKIALSLEEIASNKEVKIASVDSLKESIKKFEKLQVSLRDFGAYDSEPSRYFENLMRKAVKCLPLPYIRPDNWSLYEDVSGWENAASKLTDAAKSLYFEIQSAPHCEVMEVAKYHGWLDEF
jgi:hypothetical protein